MDATPLLTQALRAMREHRLEAVLIGNAAAALHGAPVTTLDFDFMFRDTPANLRKLKAVAKRLRAMILRPFYPASKFYRVVNDDLGLQVDFMPVLHGVRSFEGLRARATEETVAGEKCWLASLDDINIIKSKRAAALARNLAVRPVSNKSGVKKQPNSPKRRQVSRARALAGLRAESDAQLTDLIRRRLALPLEKRTFFLRRRLPGGGSCL